MWKTFPCHGVTIKNSGRTPTYAPIANITGPLWGGSQVTRGRLPLCEKNPRDVTCGCRSSQCNMGCLHIRSQKVSNARNWCLEFKFPIVLKFGRPFDSTAAKASAKLQIDMIILNKSFFTHWCHRLYHDTTLFVECKGRHLNPIEPLRRCVWNHISNTYVRYRLFQVPHSPDKSLHSRTQLSIFLLKDLACRLQRHEKDKMTPTCLPIKISSYEVLRSTPSMDLANGPLWCCSLSCLVSSGGVGRERVWQCAGADTWD